MIISATVAACFGFLFGRRFLVFALIPVSVAVGLGSYLVGLLLFASRDNFLTSLVSVAFAQAGFLLAVLSRWHSRAVLDERSALLSAPVFPASSVDEALPLLNKRLREMRSALGQETTNPNKENVASRRANTRAARW